MNGATRARFLWPTGLVLALTFVSAPAAAQPKTRIIAVIVNKQNPLRNITRAQLRAIFLKRRQTWSDGRTIVAINGSLKSKLRDAFQRQVMGMTRRQVGAYWVKQSITGRARPPRSVGSSMLSRRLVAALRGAISYVELSRIDSSVKVLSVDGVHPRDAKYKLKYQVR